jgi:hypothetical protein
MRDDGKKQGFSYVIANLAGIIRGNTYRPALAATAFPISGYPLTAVLYKFFLLKRK